MKLNNLAIRMSQIHVKAIQLNKNKFPPPTISYHPKNIHPLRNVFNGPGSLKVTY